jgi:anti-sigma factor RsiW
MKHLSEVELVEFSQGRLEARLFDAASQHLAECSQCAGRLAAIRGLMASMDAWQPARPDEHHARRSQEAHRSSRREGARSGWRIVMQKIAAVIVLAGLSGAVAGHYLARMSNQSHIPAERISEQVAAHMMHLDALAPGAMTGLDLKSSDVQLFLGSISTQ